MSVGFGAAASAEPAPVKVTPTTAPAGITLINEVVHQGPGSGAKNRPKPSIFALPFPQGTQLAYCIEFEVAFANGEHVEKPWAGSGIENLGKVQWVLTNSYPAAKTAQQLIQAAGATAPEGATEDQLKKIAYVGTQAAIWNFTDGDAFRLAPWSEGDTPKATYDVVKAIYDYLRTNAKDVPEVKPTLTIDPATATGTVGSKIGPYTVKAPAGGDVKLTATGGKVVDANGKELTTVKDGGKFYLTSDVVGTITVEAEGSYSVPTGRIFVHVNEGTQGSASRVPVHRSQKLILAGSTGEKLKAKASATVTAKPTLPVTGASVTVAVASGVVLLGGGALLLMAMRRRRVNFTA
jgi:TQXA domain-containing protein/LPXTG-motif cell wall-anchored protein